VVGFGGGCGPWERVWGDGSARGGGLVACPGLVGGPEVVFEPDRIAQVANPGPRFGMCKQ